MELKRISIIGTAGRGSDFDKLSFNSFKHMYNAAFSIILDHYDRDCILVSGGAAWADHLVVKRKLLYPEQRIELHLPCPFSLEQDKFLSREYRDTGSTANFYHKQFSSVRKVDSLKEISSVIGMKNSVFKDNYRGFKDRNLIVAKSDVVIALTFGKKEVLKDGGTQHTAGQYLASGGKELWHIDLNNYKIYKNGAVN